DIAGIYNTETEIKFKTQDTWETWSEENLSLSVNASLKDSIQNIINEISKTEISNKKD
ncbi:MAG: hypothetical protein HY934_08515, partial [Candidatus Firestonebacteria bacterium]|nr:hypothetical protein [Candidatus Firestonebacteria bacterium]